jgi:hypothetical protein
MLHAKPGHENILRFALKPPPGSTEADLESILTAVRISHRKVYFALEPNWIRLPVAMSKSISTLIATFIAGVLCGASLFQPARCLNQSAYENFDRSRLALEHQLDTVRHTRDELTLKRDQFVNEMNKRIDTLSDYEKELEDSLAEVVSAMHS